MPFSSTNGKKWTQRLLNRIVKGFSCKDSSVKNSVKILDIGPGSGTYHELLQKTRECIHWTGVEAWEPYVKQYSLAQKYNKIHIDDARKWVAKCQDSYDIAICGDVIEHMTKDEAITMYRRLIDISCIVVMSIPIVHYPQDEYEGNPYERHVKDDWSHAEVLETFSDITLYFVEGEIGVYIAARDLSIKNLIRQYHDPKIAVYGIFKNEFNFIDRMMDSISSADQIVLCDTGSTDGTYDKVISKMRSIRGDICKKIYVSPWRFDDARNVALSLIDEDIDLCISIDADEYLPSNWKQILIDQWEPRFTRYYHRFKTLWDPNDPTRVSEHWHDRIHIRHGYTWKLPVHEILEYESTEVVKWLDMFQMIQEPDTLKDRTSYLNLLEISVNERPDIWKSWTFLAQEQAALGNYDAAEASLLNAQQLESSDKAYIYKLRFYYASHCGNYHTAIDSIDLAIKQMPSCRELYYLKGEYQLRNANFPDAYVTLLAGDELPDEKRSDYHYDPRAYGDSYKSLLKTAQDEFMKIAGLENK